MASLLAAAMIAVFLVAPQEASMGESQRIVYLHVCVAWFGLLAFLLAAASGGVYLLRRNLAWDNWAQATAEAGWLCTSLTLVTGSLWAHEAWNTWWTWDPRLTTSLILWTIYAVYFVIRAGIEEPHQRARAGALVSVVGAADVPLVITATRLFRGMHPVSPEMEPRMQLVLLFTAIAFTLFFFHLLVVRRNQLELARRVEAWQRQFNPC
jgi:heme exporter protein C